MVGNFQRYQSDTAHAVAGSIEGMFGELAKHLRVSREYVTRTLRLNYLAPDIIRAVLDGRNDREFAAVSE